MLAHHEQVAQSLPLIPSALVGVGVAGYVIRGRLLDLGALLVEAGAWLIHRRRRLR